MLRPRPLLKRREAKPRRSAVLMLVVHRMVGGQMVIGVGFVQIRPGLVGPCEVAIEADVVAEVPGNVGKRTQAVGSVTEVATFIVTTGDWVNARVVPVKDDGDDQVQTTCMAEHAFKPLPVGDVEAAIIEAGVGGIV